MCAQEVKTVVKDCRNCGRTNKECEELMCHRKSAWLPKQTEAAKADAMAKLFDEMDIKVKGLEEQCARQAAISFMERYPDNAGFDANTHEWLLKTMGVGFFMGYMEATLKAKE